VIDQVVFGLSIVFQIGAALWALSLIRLVGRSYAWVMIACAFLLMVVLRLLVLWDVSADLIELSRLIVSILFFASMAGITPLLRHLHQANDELRASKHSLAKDLAARNRELEALAQSLQEAHTQLEQRVEARTAELGAANARLQQEIAERALVEHALRRSEADLRVILNTVLQVFILLAPDYTVRAFNHGAAVKTQRLFGTILREGQSICDVIPPMLKDSFTANFQRALQGELVVTERQLFAPDGQDFWFEGSHHPVIAEDGQVTGICFSVIDVTARHQAEEAYRMLVEHSQHGLNIIQDGQLVFANARSAEITGYTREEQMSLGFDEMMSRVATEDAERLEQQVSAMMGGGPPLPHVELRLARHGDGSVRWLEVYTAQIEYRGRPALQVSYSDITERKQAEEQAMALAVERERVNILADFIQAASHEFATPLSILHTSLYLLERSEDRDRQHAYVNNLKRQISYVEKLVNGLLTMSRLDSGADLIIQPVDLNGLLRLIQTRIILPAEKTDLDVTFELGGNMPTVRGDQTYLHTALMNIVDNAVRYTNAPGTIRVCSYRDDSWVVVEVRDSGIGIGPDHLVHIFERFYRVDKAHASRGVGLGLCIAKKVIEAHRGQITLESRVGRGSTVRLMLPIPPN
jgi:PAS domain S-box-containing protein